METEKIYYSAVILISALSILLSPFFYIRRGKRPVDGRVMKRQWKIVLFSNLLIVLALIAVWWFWLR